MKVISITTKEVIGEILTNHGMTVDEALEFIGFEYDGEQGYWTREDGAEAWTEDTALIYDDESDAE